MGGLSNTYENRINDFVWRQEDFTEPANFYVSLHTSDPGEDGLTGEISGDGYARAKIGSGGVTTMSDAAGSFSTQNNGAIEFNQLTADKGTATHYGLWEAASGGTFIGGGTIPGSGVILSNGDTPTIGAGVLDIRMPGGSGQDGYGKNFAGKMLNKIFRATTFAPPANVWLAHFTADPGDLGASNEVSGGGYSRKQIGTGGVSTFSSSASGQTDNDSDLSTDASGGNFGDISHSAIFDASSGGDMVMKWENDAVRDINDGESIKFLAGNLSCTVD